MHVRTMDSPLGPVTLVASEAGLVGVRMGEAGDAADGADGAAGEVLAQAEAELRAYFQGGLRRFETPVDLAGVTVFQRRVLQVAARIRYGEVWTYGQLAQAAGCPKGARAVGGAMARNPLPIVVPCHRVVASNGALRGYSGAGGLKTKRFLLDLEKGLRKPEGAAIL